jgi:hypothetical protein
MIQPDPQNSRPRATEQFRIRNSARPAGLRSKVTFVDDAVSQKIPGAVSGRRQSTERPNHLGQGRGGMKQRESLVWHHCRVAMKENVGQDVP